MHQDQRIGLALAVLLVGAAGAFFFRNEPPSETAPRLKSARILDSQIAEKSVGPYLPQEPETSNPTVAETLEGGFPLESPGFLEGNEVGSVPFPDSPGTRSNSSSGRSSGSTPLSHIVQRGETLSSIAAKTLGSSSRFQELFEANRDQLNDANDLKIGMTLRIPDKNPRVESGETPVPNPLDDAATLTETNSVPTTNSAPTANVKRFESPRRIPMGVRPAPNSALEATRPVRKLSQSPPKDPTGKVAR